MSDTHDCATCGNGAVGDDGLWHCKIMATMECWSLGKSITGMYAMPKMWTPKPELEPPGHTKEEWLEFNDKLVWKHFCKAPQPEPLKSEEIQHRLEATLRSIRATADVIPEEEGASHRWVAAHLTEVVNLAVWYARAKFEERK